MDSVAKIIEFEGRAYETLKDRWKQLLQSSPLTTFTYLQFFDNGTFTNLCSDQEWSRKYYTMEKIDEHFFQQIQIARNSGEYHIYLWPHDPSKGEITSWLHEHGIGTGFTIFKREGNKVHGWGFTSAGENYELINFYMNNKESFLKFGRQFAADYNQYSSNQKQITYAQMGIDCSIQITKDDYLDQGKLIMPTSAKIKVFIGDISHDISSGQWEVMELLSKGYSVKQIAYLLNISSKTVEQRLSNLRYQLGVYSKDQIFDIWMKNSII